MGGGYRFHRLEWRASVSDSKSGAEFCGSPKENRIGLSLDLGDMPANISLRRAKVYSPNGAVSGFNMDFPDNKLNLYILYGFIGNTSSDLEVYSHFWFSLVVFGLEKEKGSGFPEPFK